MKKTLTLFILVLLQNIGFSQVQYLGKPNSEIYQLDPHISFLKQPKVDAIVETEKENLRRQISNDKRLVFGVEHEVDYSYFNLAERVEVDSLFIYRLGIWCPNSKSVNIVFSDFYLSPNARLDIYNIEKTEIIGSHTSSNNNVNNILGTDIIFSDKVIIEVSIPKNEIGSSRLKIGTIVHGFLDLNDEIQKAIGDAGNCHYDVNCNIGLGWEDQRNSVVCVISGGSACTGSMVNTTSSNLKSYYLSANHCGVTPSSWVFRFRWERTANQTICANTNSSGNDGATNMFINGGSLKATFNRTDILLVELNSLPDPSWNVYFAGWDKSDNLPEGSVTSIHHPKRDIKKISVSNTQAIKHIIPFNGVQDVRTWKIPTWTFGSTEVGSSGSPLYNSQRRIIGVLSGGNAACNGNNPNNGEDYYARFGVAWDLGTDSLTRLKEWLDPQGLNPEYINGRYQNPPPSNFDLAISKVENVTGKLCGIFSISPRVSVLNVGSESVTSFTLDYVINGNSYLYIWNGNLSQYESVIIDLPILNFTPGNYQFDVSVLLPNSQIDSDLANNSKQTNFEVINEGDLISLTLGLDFYGSEISWQIINNLNQVIYESSPYFNGNNQIIQDTFCLNNGCYKFVINDSEGDGLVSNGAAGYLVLKNSNNQIVSEISESEANFNMQKILNFCVNNILNTEDLIQNYSFVVFPNPSNSDLNILSLEGATIDRLSIYDIQSRLIFSEDIKSNFFSIDISKYNSGIYILESEINGMKIHKNFMKK